MEPKVYLFGTSHPLQREMDPEKAAPFEREIRRILSDYGIKRIVEEMSPDGLKEKGVDQTVCQRIAGGDVPVNHVDLGREARRDLSLTR